MGHSDNGFVAVLDILAQETARIAEVERVIVTGSNIPTAEESGPNPVDTYRPQDIEKLGIRNATDLLPYTAGNGRDREPEYRNGR